MAVERIVPNLPVADVHGAAELYARLLGLEVSMDMGWIGSVVAAERRHVQLSVMTADATAEVSPSVSVDVGSPAEVDAVYERVRDAGLSIVYPPHDEEWGVHRFFFTDPDGNVINVVAHT